VFVFGNPVYGDWFWLSDLNLLGPVTLKPRSPPGGAKSRRDSKCVSMQTVTDDVVPHFHNEPGVPVIEIGAKKFMCIGALPPQDHPHVFCDMGEDVEYVCPYCSTLYRHNPALAPNQARPAECELHDVII
jgi:uncharacterized Zn-finger protein